MKVQATLFKGIEFVSFHELPADQQLLLQYNTQIERIKILIDGKVSGNCIQYKDYSAWYASVFVKSVTPVKDLKQVELTESVVSRG